MQDTYMSHPLSFLLVYVRSINLEYIQIYMSIGPNNIFNVQTQLFYFKERQLKKPILRKKEKSNFKKFERRSVGLQTVGDSCIAPRSPIQTPCPTTHTGNFG